MSVLPASSTCRGATTAPCPTSPDAAAGEHADRVGPAQRKPVQPSLPAVCSTGACAQTVRRSQLRIAPRSDTDQPDRAEFEYTQPAGFRNPKGQNRPEGKFPSQGIPAAARPCDAAAAAAVRSDPDRTRPTRWPYVSIQVARRAVSAAVQLHVVMALVQQRQSGFVWAGPGSGQRPPSDTRCRTCSCRDGLAVRHQRIVRVVGRQIERAPLGTRPVAADAVGFEHRLHQHLVVQRPGARCARRDLRRCSQGRQRPGVGRGRVARLRGSRCRWPSARAARTWRSASSAPPCPCHPAPARRKATPAGTWKYAEPSSSTGTVPITNLPGSSRVMPMFG